MTYYIKVVDGVIEKYPYSFLDLKKDNPNTSFPIGYSNEEGLAALDVYILRLTERPEESEIDPLTQQIVEGTPILQDDVWTQVWEIENLPQHVAETNVRSRRTYLLDKSDYKALVDNNMSQEWVDYRQALRDITTQDGFPYSVSWPSKPL